MGGCAACFCLLLLLAAQPRAQPTARPLRPALVVCLLSRPLRPQVRLRHRDTGAYLANHNLKYQRPIPGHTEVMALKERSAKTTWLATEGVYFAGRDEH